MPQRRVLARVAGLPRAPRLLYAPCLDQRWFARLPASNPLDPGFDDGNARPSAGFRAYAGPERRSCAAQPVGAAVLERQT